MMKGLLVRVLDTFRSAPLYARSLRVEQGSGFAWLAFVCLLAAVPVVVRVHHQTLTEGKVQGAEFIAQMPTLRFDQGRLSTEPSGQQRITVEARTYLVIDADIEGVTDEVDRGQILMTGDYFVTRQKNDQIRATPYDWIGTRVVTQDDLRRWWEWWARYGWALLLPFMFCTLYIGFGAFTVLLSLAALAIARAAGVAAGYTPLLHTTALAATPSIVLDAVNDMFGRPLPLGFLARATITIAFLLFAVHAARSVPEEAAA